MNQGVPFFQRPRLNLGEISLIAVACFSESERRKNPEPKPGEKPWQTKRRIEQAEELELLFKKFLNLLATPERRKPEWELSQ